MWTLTPEVAVSVSHQWTGQPGHVDDDRIEEGAVRGHYQYRRFGTARLPPPYRNAQPSAGVRERGELTERPFQASAPINADSAGFCVFAFFDIFCVCTVREFLCVCQVAFSIPPGSVVRCPM